MTKASAEFIRSLVEKHPSLDPLLREHLVDFGEVLPHVFFGDLTRYVISEFCRFGDDHTATDGPQLKGLLDELERAFAAGTDEVSELIAVSFLENLPRPGEEGAGVRDLLGPALRAELRRIP